MYLILSSTSSAIIVHPWIFLTRHGTLICWQGSAELADGLSSSYWKRKDPIHGFSPLISEGVQAISKSRFVLASSCLLSILCLNLAVHIPLGSVVSEVCHYKGRNAFKLLEGNTQMTKWFWKHRFNIWKHKSKVFPWKPLLELEANHLLDLESCNTIEKKNNLTYSLALKQNTT